MLHHPLTSERVNFFFSILSKISIFAPETAASLFDTECVAPLDLPGYPTAHLETNHHRSGFLLPTFGSPNPDYPTASTSPRPSTQGEST